MGSIKLTQTASKTSDPYSVEDGIKATGQTESKTSEPDSVEEGITATGIVRLVPDQIDEFHLPGQHDQSTHGRPQNGSTGGRIPGAQAVRKGVDYNPNPGTFTPEQQKTIRDFGHNPEDYTQNGKLITGTDSWLDAHGISREVYNTRPMKRWTSSQDPVFDEIYADFADDPSQKRFAKKIAGQSSGLIMIRKPAPGAIEAGFGPVSPQARPDEPIITDGRTLARKNRELNMAKDRQAKVHSEDFTANDVILERQARVNRAKGELKQLKTIPPEDIRAAAQQKKDAADVNLRKAEKSGDVDRIADAQIKARNADYFARDEKRKAQLLEKDPERALKIVGQEQKRAEGALARAKANPEAALKNIRDYSDDQVVSRQKQLDGVAVKYVFPPGQGKAARIEVNQDKQNVKNLVEGKGRVYFIMEGNLKADAALTAVKKEDPTAAVISVPSVTAWPGKETDWVAKKYLQGRDVVLIPDADGVNNVDVTRQAINLKGKLLSNGVTNVKVAAPPLVRDKSGKLDVEPLKLPSGKEDARKGLDDHLGLGKGTLGDLIYSDTKTPNFDLTNLSKQNKVKSHSVQNSNKVLNAISDMAGERAAGKISDKSIEKYTGLASSSVNDSVIRLEKMGVIKVHHIFDPKLLGEGRREQIMEYDEIKRVTKKAGAKLPNLDIKYVNDFDNHEIAPIIEIVNTKYITKQGPPRSLASDYKSLKTSKKTFGVARIKASRPGVRLVQSSEGAKRYGVPIGSPIPEVKAQASGTIHLAPIIIDTKVSIHLAPTILDTDAKVEEFHLPGQHDQGTHGRGGGGSIPGGLKLSSMESSLLKSDNSSTKRRDLSGGRSGAKVELINSPFGKAVVKSGMTKTDADREYLASKVGKALGANVPIVARKGSGAIVSEFLPGKIAGTFRRDIGRVLPLDRTARKRAVRLKGGKELALLDVAIANKDRHGGNILIRPGGKSISGIDHTTSFGGKVFIGLLPPSRALENHWKKGFTKNDYKNSLKKVEPLKAEFKKAGREDWYEDMVGRLNDEAEKVELSNFGSITLI